MTTRANRPTTESYERLARQMRREAIAHMFDAAWMAVCRACTRTLLRFA